MSRDCKRPTTQHYIHCSQQSQQHIVTCSEMYDVWINEIGPKLDVIDIVRLSMVNQWARHIAHNIKQQKNSDYAIADSILKFREGAAWPDLRWRLMLGDWCQGDTSDATDSKWCDVVSLNLWNCKIFDFSFVEPHRLGTIAIYNGWDFQKLDSRTSNSLATMLVSCASLESLSLEKQIDQNDDVEWLVNVLAHLTRLSHLSLRSNGLGAQRMKRVSSVLCHLPHITSLNLGWNSLGEEGVRYFFDCIHNMPNIKTLDLSHNEIGAVGVTHIYTALANNRLLLLVHLNLYANNMGTDGVRLLMPCLAQLPNLSFLDVQSNGVDRGTRQQARRMLIHVKMLHV